MYIILNVTEKLPWDEEMIPKQRPSYVHSKEEKALDEMCRLKSQSPDDHFVLFKAVSEMKSDKVILEPIKEEI